MSRVLVIGDIHLPVDHVAYRRFVMDLRNKFKTRKTIFIGDVIDHHAISFHAANPNCPGPTDEYELAQKAVNRWQKSFPNAIVTIGNHDQRCLRLAESVNIPARYLRNYREVWGTKGWKWVEEVVIDDTLYTHGTGCGGEHPAYNLMKKQLMNCVIGHAHSASGVKWKANPRKRIFGMDTGCGIDIDAYQFAYGKYMPNKPVLSAGVVLDGIPQHFIMPCDVKEKYHKSRFQ